MPMLKYRAVFAAAFSIAPAADRGDGAASCGLRRFLFARIGSETRLINWCPMKPP
jgi:hypothetical protein